MINDVSPLAFLTVAIATNGNICRVDGDDIGFVRKAFGERCISVGVCTYLAQSSFEHDIVGVRDEVEYFTKFLPLEIPVEPCHHDVFVVLHHELHCDFEIGKELCLVDGDGVVGTDAFEQQFVGFDGGHTMTVVCLQPCAFVIGMVDDQAPHANRRPPIDFAHEFRTFSRVHTTDDDFE